MPPSSVFSEPKPNCKKVPVSSCSKVNLLAVAKGLRIDLTPSVVAFWFVVSTKTTSCER